MDASIPILKPLEAVGVLPPVVFKLVNWNNCPADVLCIWNNDCGEKFDWLTPTLCANELAKKNINTAFRHIVKNNVCVFMAI
jgi:hypothetical protein